MILIPLLHFLFTLTYICKEDQRYAYLKITSISAVDCFIVFKRKEEKLQLIRSSRPYLRLIDHHCHLHEVSQ